MKKSHLWLGILAITLVFAMLAVGCDDGTTSGGGGGKTLEGNVTISPSANVTTGTELPAAYSGSETVSYQWNKGGTPVQGAAGNKFTPPEAGIFTVTASAEGYKSKTSVAVVVTIPVLTGTVSITGSAEAGQTLTANTASLGGSGTLSYQWKRGETVIGTDSNTYVVQTADIDGDDYRNRFPRRLYGQCYQRAHARYHRSSSLNAGAGFYTDKQQYGLFGCQRHGKRRRSDHTGCV